MPKTASPIRDRFFSKVINIPFHTCWEWIGSKHPDGYGLFHVGKYGKKPKSIMRAHRFSWELHFGRLLEELCVLHKCDNRSCVNPDHLFLGSQLENIKDMHNKKRHAFGTRNNSKLTEDEVQEIRRRVASGQSLRKVGIEFKIGHNTVRKIVIREIWNSVV